MRVSEVHLKNFKRFTDLVIRNIPATATVVVVVGRNGCGKSSLFDAFMHWHRVSVRGGGGDETYYRKDSSETYQFHRAVEVKLHGESPVTAGSLYVRTAYRNDPDFSVRHLEQPKIPTDNPRFHRLIDDDRSVSDNYRRLVYDTTSGVYSGEHDSKSVRELREGLIGGIQGSLRRVFGDLTLNSISDPLGAGTFFFRKGSVESYHYKNLSGGEKAVFDLIVDVHLKKKFFSDALYCIDEMDTHLHTSVQGALLKELVEIMPLDSQLWVTTHALGVLRAAQTMEQDDSGSVCILDFDAIDDLDAASELLPATLDKVTWEKMLSVTIDDLAPQVAPRYIVVCEGSPDGNKRKDFDAEIYNRIFGQEVSDVVFISGGSSDQVKASGVSTKTILKGVLPNTKVISLIDRDDKSDEQVSHFEASGGIVLEDRNLESYLFADDVLQALATSVNKSNLINDVLQTKTVAVASSVARGNPPDDLKSAAGEIYTNLKKLLGLQRGGEGTDAFMRDTLASLIRPEMTTYQKLKSEILDRLA